jgi:poly(A) polymerase
MALLGVPQGPLVGKAYRHLLELRMERGPLPREDAERALLDWAAAQGVQPAG